MNAPIPVAEAFRYCPRCGAARHDPGVHPLRCSACEFVFYFGPVGAVGAIITDDAGRVLLIRRAKDPGKGKFGLPGGFVDPGEAATEALVREVREELGLTVTELTILASFPNTYAFRGVVLPVLDLFYVCSVQAADDIQAAENEVASWQWSRCEPHVLEQMAFESNRQALRLFAAGSPS